MQKQGRGYNTNTDRYNTNTDNYNINTETLFRNLYQY